MAATDPITRDCHRVSTRLLRLLWVGLATLVLLPWAAFADEPADDEFAEDAPPPEKQVTLVGSPVYLWVWNSQFDAVTARKELDAILRQKIAIVNEVCRLSSGQKQKLRLAGRGDIRFFFDRVEEIDRQFQRVKNDPDMVKGLIEEAQSLRRHITPRLVEDGSRFIKALKSLLTAEQLAKYRSFEGLFGAGGLVQLRQLGADEGLEIVLSQIGDDELKHLRELPGLHELRLLSTQVADAGLVHLTGLTDLRALYLDNSTHVTHEGLAHLKGLTDLRQLSLRSTAVSDAGLAHLNQMTSLQGLALGGTQVTDAGLVHLKGLTSLRVLGLNNTQVTDAGLSHLKGLAGLEHLSLENTQVTDAGVAELKRALPGLTVYR
jgi:hypothetical protein